MSAPHSLNYYEEVEHADDGPGAHSAGRAHSKHSDRLEHSDHGGNAGGLGGQPVGAADATDAQADESAAVKTCVLLFS